MSNINLISYLFCILLGITASTIFGITTLVYNMRIAETTKAKNRALVEPLPSIGALTTFAQFRAHNNPLRQSVGGALGTYIYARKGWYARVNAAAGKVHAHACDIVSISRTQMDDILFTGGYGWRPSDQSSISLSGHLGIPTHNDDSLQLFQLGTGHVGLGAQIDGAYAYNEAQTFIGAARFIHFFPRDVHLTLQEVNHTLTTYIGNAFDLLFTYQHTWGPHLLGIGYNPTFIFGAKLEPTLPAFSNLKTHTTTNSFFCSYRYGFLLGTHLSAIIFGISYGFGSTPVPNDKVHTTTAWFSGGINF
jgi:hypothetical protein